MLTLLTDFGLQDPYVGVMKGVIAQINPALSVVDLTHQIPPQDLAAARFNLLMAYPYFPTGTVHVVVVDPGVGSQRRAVAIQIPGGFLVGPDNGVLSGVLEHTPANAAVELSNPAYWRSPQPSTTFHGRDIFVPAAAHLASGVPLAQLGKGIDPNTLVRTALPTCTPTPSGYAGAVQYIDRFGNVMTNIPGEYASGRNLTAGAIAPRESAQSSPLNPTHQSSGWTVAFQQQRIPGHTTYSDVPAGGLLALVGSHGWVEIAVNGGSAQEQLQVAVGDRVSLSII